MTIYVEDVLGRTKKNIHRILIIDDDKNTQITLQNIFHLKGFTTEIAGTGREALDKAMEGFFHVALLDVKLPDVNGVELLENLKAIHPDMMIIMATAYASVETAVSALNKGASAFITKPLNMDEVLAIIKQVIEKQDLIVENRKLFQSVKWELAERKRTEVVLQESEEKYRTITEHINAGIYRKNPGEKGGFIEVNPAFVRMFGYSNKEELLKVQAIDLYRHITDFEKNEEKMLNDGFVKNEELLMKRKDGTDLWVSMTAVSIGDPKGQVKYYDGMIEDITERKRVEEENKRFQDQLIQAQKMDAIGALSGGIAHDFNNLLTTIKGCTEMAIINIDDKEALIKDLEEIQDASRCATDLTRQLLIFSRRHPMEFIPLNINRLVREMLKMMHRLIGEDIVIETELELEPFTVWADRGTMEQVMMNLFINARDAMPKGGKLTVRTKNVHIDSNYCKKVPEARAGKFVCLSVKDTGVGMTEEILEHIFEPFFSTKGCRDGTGLGLSVVYGIVKQHEGWIEVKSKPDKGTLFHVFISAVPVKPEEETEKMISVEEFKGHGEKILVVEDEESVREFVRRALDRTGYQVHTASNDCEALDIFVREKKNFHLVFSDVVLPDKTGVELVEELRSRNPELRVLLCSGYVGWKSQWPLIEEKGFLFLQKPYALIDLLRTIREALNSD